MPKTSVRTFLVISILIGFFFAASLKNRQHPIQNQRPMPSFNLTRASISFGSLSQSLISSQTVYSLPVLINTQTDKVTGVQLELKYDPAVIENLKINPGSFFTSPITLISRVDATNGRISYVIVLAPQEIAKSGSGVVATLGFNSSAKVPTQTSIQFLPKSLVTAQGIKQSVLSAVTPAQIIVGQ